MHKKPQLFIFLIFLVLTVLTTPVAMASEISEKARLLSLSDIKYYPVDDYIWFGSDQIHKKDLTTNSIGYTYYDYSLAAAVDNKHVWLLQKITENDEEPGDYYYVIYKISKLDLKVEWFTSFGDNYYCNSIAVDQNKVYVNKQAGLRQHNNALISFEKNYTGDFPDSKYHHINTRPAIIIPDKKYLWFTHMVYGETDPLLHRKTISRFNKNDGTHELIEVGDRPQGLAVDQEYVWVTIPSENKIAKIKKEDLSVQHIAIDSGISLRRTDNIYRYNDVAVDQNYLWFLAYDFDSNTTFICRMQKSDNVIETFMASDLFRHLYSIDDNYLWVGTQFFPCRLDKYSREINCLEGYFKNSRVRGDLTGFYYDLLFNKVTSPTKPTVSAPGSISVPSSSNTGSYTVSWGSSSTAGVTYVLEEATNSAFTSNRRTAYSGSGTSTNITGRSSGNTYYYRVKATRSGYNDSAWRTAGNGCLVNKNTISLKDQLQIVGATHIFIYFSNYLKPGCEANPYDSKESTYIIPHAAEAENGVLITFTVKNIGTTPLQNITFKAIFHGNPNLIKKPFTKKMINTTVISPGEEKMIRIPDIISGDPDPFSVVGIPIKHFQDNINFAGYNMKIEASMTDQNPVELASYTGHNYLDNKLTFGVAGLVPYKCKSGKTPYSPYVLNVYIPRGYDDEKKVTAFNNMKKKYGFKPPLEALNDKAEECLSGIWKSYIDYDEPEYGKFFKIVNDLVSDDVVESEKNEVAIKTFIKFLKLMYDNVAGSVAQQNDALKAIGNGINCLTGSEIPDKSNWDSYDEGQSLKKPIYGKNKTINFVGDTVIKVLDGVKGLLIGEDRLAGKKSDVLFKSQQSSKSPIMSMVAFEFKNGEYFFNVELADFNGNSKIIAMDKNGNVLKIIDVKSKSHQFYLIQNVGTIYRVEIISDSAWLGEVRHTIKNRINVLPGILKLLLD